MSERRIPITEREDRLRYAERQSKIRAFERLHYADTRLPRLRQRNEKQVLAKAAAVCLLIAGFVLTILFLGGLR